VGGRGRLAPGRVEARRLSPTFTGVVRVRVPPAGLSGGSSIGRALDDPVCAPHIRPPSCRPRPPSPRLRCGHGSKTAGYLSENRNPPAVGASSVSAPEARPGGSKTAGYPQGRLVRQVGRLSRRFGGCRCGCRGRGGSGR
jgi:hypothetical protein